MNRFAMARIIGSLALVVVFVLYALGGWQSASIVQIERWIYDTRLINSSDSATGTPEQQVVIVDIDDKSLSQLGQWPWRRDILAQLNDQLFDTYQIKALGYDVMFAEPSDDTPEQILNLLAAGPLAQNVEFIEAYQALGPQIQFDQTFAQSLASRPIVMGLVFDAYQDIQTNQLPESWGQLPANLAQQLILPQANGYTANLAILHQHSISAGFFDNPLLDSDGVFRRVPLLQSYQDEIYPSLALATTLAAFPDWQIELFEHELGYIALQLGDKTIPLDTEASVYVPYLGGQASFSYVSAVDVLTADAPMSSLQNKIVLLGSSAAGLLDLRTTPFQEGYAGVEVHANIIEGILDERILKQPLYVILLELIQLVLIAVLIVFSPFSKQHLAQMLYVAVIGLSIVFFAQLAWQYMLIVPLATSLLLLLSLFVFHLAVDLLWEARNRQGIAAQFGQYVPPELVEQMALEPGLVSSKSENKELTVLFSDVRGFTAISESMSAAELSALMNLYLSEMTRLIHQHKGTIDKYIGDAVMAFWGAPVVDEQHTKHAIATAVAMQTAMPALNEQLAKQGWPTLHIGIGINTGVMSVGNMGSDFRMAYTVMGDSVNLAARLEGLTKQYGVGVITSEFCRASLQDCPDFCWLPLDRVRVKGKQDAVTIYQPLPNEPQHLNMVKLASDFMRSYQQQDWPQALSLLEQLLVLDAQYQTLVDLFQSRIADYQLMLLPDDWDGVFEHQSK